MAKDKSGKRLEKAVARIQQMMDKDSVVTHNEKITDRLGIERQYDVVIRGTFGGKSMLGVIECKDHNRKKGPADVGEFAKRTEHLGANLRIMVSSKGFTRQALKLAKHEFISCLSLLRQDPEDGVIIGQFWYGIIRRWKDVRLVLRFSTPVLNLGEWSYDGLLWRKQPIMNWFLNELFTKHATRDPGNYYLSLSFPEGLLVELNGSEYIVAELGCRGTLVAGKKRKWVSWAGDAYFDWHKNQLQVPAGTPIVSSAVETDMALWEDYEGEIPQKARAMELLLIVTGGQRLQDDDPIPDLMSVQPIYSMTVITE